jgi:hypothetical protein
LDLRRAAAVIRALEARKKMSIEIGWFCIAMVWIGVLREFGRGFLPVAPIN